MKALRIQGPEQLLLDDAPEPKIEAPTDAIVAVTKTALCGADCRTVEAQDSRALDSFERA